MTIEIISLLVCPITKGKLLFDRESNYLISRQAELAFAIKEGVPDMLVEHAMSLSEFKRQFPDSSVFKDNANDQTN